MKYDENELVERARIAFAKSGAADQPGEESDVVELNSVAYVVLRNVNGILAVYDWDGAALTRAKTWPPELD